MGLNGTVVQCKTACTSSLSNWKASRPLTRRTQSPIPQPLRSGLHGSGTATWLTVGSPTGGYLTSLVRDRTSNCTSSTTDGTWNTDTGDPDRRSPATLYAVAQTADTQGGTGTPTARRWDRRHAHWKSQGCASPAPAGPIETPAPAPPRICTPSRTSPPAATTCRGGRGHHRACNSNCYKLRWAVSPGDTDTNGQDEYGVTRCSGASAGIPPGPSARRLPPDQGITWTWSAQTTPLPKPPLPAPVHHDPASTSRSPMPRTAGQRRQHPRDPVAEPGLVPSGTTTVKTNEGGVAIFSNLTITTAATGYVKRRVELTIGHSKPGRRRASPSPRQPTTSWSSPPSRGPPARGRAFDPAVVKSKTLTATSRRLPKPVRWLGGGLRGQRLDHHRPVGILLERAVTVVPPR